MNCTAPLAWTHAKNWSDGCGVPIAENRAVSLEPIFHPDWR
jgi:hypothetical protein